ncbi:MAG: hypothetical protein JNJ88_21060 [Planctomycetes bacterium]|nr:hypothetical protein [Planctomycetota bacterium]
MTSSSRPTFAERFRRRAVVGASVSMAVAAWVAVASAQSESSTPASKPAPVVQGVTPGTKAMPPTPPRDRYTAATPITMDRIRSVFRGMDLNDDEQVTLKEALAAGSTEAQFRYRDLDGDGLLAREEFDLCYGKEVLSRGQQLDSQVTMRIAHLEKLGREREWRIPSYKAGVPQPTEAPGGAPGGSATAGKEGFKLPTNPGGMDPAELADYLRRKSNKSAPTGGAPENGAPKGSDPRSGDPRNGEPKSGAKGADPRSGAKGADGKPVGGEGADGRDAGKPVGAPPPAQPPAPKGGIEKPGNSGKPGAVQPRPPMPAPKVPLPAAPVPKPAVPNPGPMPNPGGVKPAAIPTPLPKPLPGPTPKAR